MRFIASIAFVIVTCNLKAQVFWTEAFGGGACSSGLSAIGFNSGNGAWAVTNTGTNNSSANAWFVSAKERGMGVGICGAGCGGTNNRTLHLGSTGLFLDLGAAYNETNAGNITDKRAESPVINCTGRTTITLAFNYMEFGQGLADNCTLWYFNGTVWAQLIDIPKTLCCSNAVCNGFNQGLWTAYSIALPVSANNNAAVRIGFRWVNNGNGIGTDPSFAVDDITLSVPVVLPIELVDFSYAQQGNGVKLFWETAMEKNADRFEVERSLDATSFITIGKVDAKNEGNGFKQYTFTDPQKPPGLVYYRLKMLDKDKSHKYSKLLTVESYEQTYLTEPVFYNSDTKSLEVSRDYLKANGFESLMIYNMEGKQLFRSESVGATEGPGPDTFRIENFVPGIYFCMLDGVAGRRLHKIFIH